MYLYNYTHGKLTQKLKRLNHSYLRNDLALRKLQQNDRQYAILHKTTDDFNTVPIYGKARNVHCWLHTWMNSCTLQVSASVFTALHITSAGALGICTKFQKIVTSMAVKIESKRVGLYENVLEVSGKNLSSHLVPNLLHSSIFLDDCAALRSGRMGTIRFPFDRNVWK